MTNLRFFGNTNMVIGDAIINDGNHYCGELRKGVPYGWGEERDSEGTLVYSGMWKKGKYHYEGAIYFEGVIYYEGIISNNQPHGKGIEWERDYYGNLVGKYEGSFKKGLKHGDFSFYNMKGDIIKFSKWKNGEKLRERVNLDIY